MNNVNANLHIDFTKMGIFAEVHRGGGDLKTENGIVQLTKDNRLTYGGDRSFGECVSRSDDDREANNKVRAELLNSLGTALGLQEAERDKTTGRLKFPPTFKESLTRLLGKKGMDVLELGNFTLKGGFVTSGKPLTERRLTLLNNYLAQHAAQPDVENQEHNRIKGDIQGTQSTKLQQKLASRFSDERIEFFSGLGSEGTVYSELFNFLEYLLPNETAHEGTYNDHGKEQTFNTSRAFVAETFHKKLKPLFLAKNDPKITHVVLDRTLSEINDYIDRENKSRPGGPIIEYLTPENFEERYRQALEDLKKTYTDNIPEDSTWKQTFANANSFDDVYKIKENLSNYRLFLQTKASEKCIAALEKIAPSASIKIKIGEDGDGNPIMGAPVFPEYNALQGRLDSIFRTLGTATRSKGAVSSDQLRNIVFGPGTTSDQTRSMMDCLLEIGSLYLQKLDAKLEAKQFKNVKGYLVDAFAELSKLFLFANDPPDKNEAQTIDQIRKKLEWVKAPAKVPDELQSYNNSNGNLLMNRFRSLLKTYRKMDAEPQIGRFLKHVDEVAGKNNHTEPTVGDFIEGILDNERVSKKFASVLKNHLPGVFKDNNLGSEGLFNLLKNNRTSILADHPTLEEIAGRLIPLLKQEVEKKDKNVEWKPDNTYVQGVMTALVDGMHFHVAKSKGDNQDDLGTKFKTRLATLGGGLNSIHERTFQLEDNQFMGTKLKGKEFKSVVTPKNQVLHTCKVAISPDDPPLANLATSELKYTENNEDKTLITFNRFGVVGTNAANIGEHYRQLAIQTFLANPSLITLAKEKGATGEIDVPLWRVDLAENNNLDEHQLEDDKGNPRGLEKVEFEMTLTNNEKIKVTLKPTVHHFHMPIDSAASAGMPLINKNFADDNAKALEELKSSVQKFPDDDVVKKKAVTNLMQQIEDGFREIANLKEAMPSKAEDLLAMKYGPKLTRLGARIAVLTSLLGNVPSINCNWGRDRTGAMDNECKLVALQVQEFIANGKPDAEFITPVTTVGDEDPDIELRTSLLEKTGNQEIAREINCTIHPINVQQCGTVVVVDENGDSEKKIHKSRFETLFKKSA